MAYGKEALFNYYLYKNKAIIENVIKLKINLIEIEKYIYFNKKVRRVDIVAKTSQNKKVFCEVQLTKADKIHLEQILFNIDVADIVIWISSGFNEKFIKIIEKEIEKREVKFYAVTFPLEVIAKLKYLYNLNIKDATQRVNILNDIKTLLIVYKSIDVYSDSNNNLSRKKILENIKSLIENKIKDNYRINFSKRIIDNSFMIGAGKADISYRISIKKDGKAIIALFFSIGGKKFFYKILKDKEKIIKNTDIPIMFDEKYTKIYYTLDTNFQLQNFELVAESFKSFYYYTQEILNNYIK